MADFPHTHTSHDHNHDHDHDGPHVHPASHNLWIAFALNLLFTLIELVGGLLTNSMAILSDAVHDLGDTFAIGSALVMERYAQKRRNRKFSYGYKRLSPLSALVNVVILLSGSLVILIETLPRLWQDPVPVHAQGMMLLAVLGVAMNGAAVWRLRKGKGSVNQRVVMLHLLEDALGWVAVLIGSGIIWLTDWYWIDPLLSLAIACYIMYNAIRSLRSVLNIFLQAIPEEVNPEKIQQKLIDLADVASVHDTHIWSLDGRYHVLTVHLVLSQDLSLEELVPLKQRIRSLLKDEHIQHVTVEFELQGEECEMEDR